jgi:hypothetical protein
MIDPRRPDVGHDCNCSPYLCEVCNPRRTLIRAMLHQSLRATADRLTPDNVTQLPSRRGARAAGATRVPLTAPHGKSTRARYPMAFRFSIALEMGVSIWTIYDIKSLRSWRHI